MSHYESDQKQQMVRRLLEAGNSRTKIAEITKIPQRTVDMYIHNIHEQDKVLWSQEAYESLENRSLLLKQKYEKLAVKAEAIIDDPDCSAKDLDIAGKLLIACHMNILDMLRHGPKHLRKNKDLEDKTSE